MADLASVCDLTDRVPAATGAGASATLAAAQAAVLAYLNYDPRPVAVTEWYDGTGTYFLPLSKPTTAALITAVTEFHPWSGDGGSGTALVADEDYVLRSPFVLERLGQTWPVRWERPPGRLAFNQETGKRQISVTMTPSADPGLMGVLKEATLLTAATLWNSRRAGFGFQTSESVDGYSQSFTPFSLGGSASGSGAPVLVSPAAQLLLRPFRRPAIGGL